jgi:hypothetical protein
LLALGAIRLYNALHSSLTVPMAGGFQATIQLAPASAGSKAATAGIIAAGLFLVLK